MTPSHYWHEAKINQEIVKHIMAGHVVAGTSDTVVGLLAAPTRTGFTALNRIKGRSEKPYIILIGSREQADLFTDAFIHDPLKTLVKHCWPGPLTVIVPLKKAALPFLQSSQSTIALRFPNHKGLQIVALHTGGLFSTSANLTNTPPPRTIDELDPAIAQNVALIIDEQPRSNTAVPSTIIDCTTPNIRLVREGAYPLSKLRRYVPDITEPMK